MALQKLTSLYCIFFQILRKFQAASVRKITFENFLRALKWVEQAEIEDKVRGKEWKSAMDLVFFLMTFQYL